jgi:hypothetical protein
MSLRERFTHFVLAKNEPKNRVGRVEELAIASAENLGEILLKMQNSLRSNSCIFFTQNLSKLFILQSLTRESIGITFRIAYFMK